jgi:hypothetical protein
MKILAVLILLAAQAKENPQFDAWKNLKAGSWVKLKVETIEDGEKTLSEETETLVSAAGDKVVVERKVVATLGGQPFTTKETEQVPAASDAILKIEKGGDEQIEAAGKKLDCRIIFVTKKAVDSTGEIRHKLWIHADVPGGVARSESVSVRQNRLVSTAMVVGWEKK